jgi:hypothetical protein
MVRIIPLYSREYFERYLMGAGGEDTVWVVLSGSVAVLRTVEGGLPGFGFGLNLERVNTYLFLFPTNSSLDCPCFG